MATSTAPSSPDADESTVAPVSRRGFSRHLLGASAVAVLVAMGKRDTVQAAPLTDTWKLGGNTGVNTDGTNFLGTTNVAPLIFKTAATAGSPLERMRITPTGNVGIGYTNPTARLQVDNTTAIAIYGRQISAHSTAPAIQGETRATATGATGVLGKITSTTPGVNSAGVHGVNNGTNGNGAGVRGTHAGSGIGVQGSSQDGFGGEFTSNNYRGMYVRGGPSWISAFLDGWTYVNGNLDVTANAWITGDLSVSGDCVGCTSAYNAQNSGTTPIAAGDLVTAAGVAVDPERGTPVLLVRRAERGDEAVIGVATGALTPTRPKTDQAQGDQSLASFVPAKGEAVPSGYLRIVTRGLARVRVDMPGLRIGEVLVAGANGRATRGAASTRVARVMSEQDEHDFVWAMVAGN